MNKTAKILVVCHDAGGAEIVSSYVRKNSNRESFLCYVAGPAQKIFARKGIPTTVLTQKKYSLNTIFNSAGPIKYLLCGSSWASDLEKEFILFAKKIGLKTVVYLDHWMNYRERFGYPSQGWQKNVPTELWVGDSHALTLVKKDYQKFKDLKIKFVKNEYLKEVVVQSKMMSSDIVPTILFIGEPVSQAQNIFTTQKVPPITEFNVLAKILETVQKKNLLMTVLVRLHPAEQKNKYNSILKSYSKTISVRVSKEPDIVQDLVQATVVVGMSSMALALAYVAGKKTISVLSKPSRCPIPYPLIKLQSLTKLGSALSS